MRDVAPLLVSFGVLTASLVGGCTSTGAGPQDRDGAVADGQQAAGEGGPGTTDGPDASDASVSPVVSFARDVFPIVSTWCAIPACHGTGTVTNHMTNFATEASTYMRWVNGPGFDFCADVEPGVLFATKIIVVPGEPGRSFLMEKISSTREEQCRDFHHPRMPPPPMPPLAPEQIAMIGRWIAEGAVNN